MFMLALLMIAALASAAVTFVSYVLWPTWPRLAAIPEAPAIPITVAGVLFDVPPGAVRTVMQRYSGPHDRIDLALQWPSLTVPDSAAKKPIMEPASDVAVTVDDRLFVSIAGLGNVLPPIERLRTIYPRYAQSQADAGPDGLAILPFRAGSPYQSEDLVYFADNPEQFFARCTRDGGALPGICIYEQLVDAAAVTFRFPRSWLGDWRNVAAGFDRLVARLHPKP